MPFSVKEITNSSLIFIFFASIIYHTFSFSEMTFWGIEYQFSGTSGSKFRFLAKLIMNSLRVFLSAQ